MPDFETIETILARAPVWEREGFSIRQALGTFFLRVTRPSQDIPDLGTIGCWDGRGWWVQPADLREAVIRVAAFLTQP